MVGDNMVTTEEAIKKLQNEKKAICIGCVHPQQMGYCENVCKLPQVYEKAIEALEDKRE